MGHENKCANVHGHNYIALFEAAVEPIRQGDNLLPGQLDSIGRVIDFGVLKSRIGHWIDEKWDHGFLLNKEDEELRKALEPVKAYDTGGGFMRATKLYLCPFNPTAEEMAHYLLTYVCPLVLGGTGVVVQRVVVWETENCYAEAKL
jgi:6-pyruvoyltetrahydropterin/6-carboxytetrahydropterin synthase